MVGLSVILESNNQGDFRNNHKSSQVIRKASLVHLYHHHSSSPSVRLRLRFCYLCKQNLLPGNDIYMYKGDRGFCSVECRCRQISMDEEESENFLKTPSFSSSESGSSSSSSSSATAVSRNSKSTRNRRGEFAY